MSPTQLLAAFIVESGASAPIAALLATVGLLCVLALAAIGFVAYKEGWKRPVIEQPTARPQAARHRQR